MLVLILDLIASRGGALRGDTLIEVDNPIIVLSIILFLLDFKNLEGFMVAPEHEERRSQIRKNKGEEVNGKYAIALFFVQLFNHES